MLKIFDTDKKQMRFTITLPKVFKRDHNRKKNETQIRFPIFKHYEEIYLHPRSLLECKRCQSLKAIVNYLKFYINLLFLKCGIIAQLQFSLLYPKLETINGSLIFL